MAAAVIWKTLRSALLVALAASACRGTSITDVYETLDGASAVAVDAAGGRDAATEDSGAPDSGLAVVPDAAPDTVPDAIPDSTPDSAPAPDSAPDSSPDSPADGPESGVTPIGQPCTTDSDCVASACDSLISTCVASQCDDHRLDGAETDVDCGGPACPVCASGQLCDVDDDCATFACDALMHVCITDACQDHRTDYAETDVDCGGGTCPACALGEGCFAPSDCGSDICDALMHVCISNQCEDHVQDGSETDVDCGGSCCINGAMGCCGVGKHCVSNFDCMSGYPCNAGTKRCQ
jgi:hypothetical protein